MGSCFGSNRPNSQSSETASTTLSYLWLPATDDTKTDLITTTNEHYESNNLLHRIIKFKRKKNSSKYWVQLWPQKDNYIKLNKNCSQSSQIDLPMHDLDGKNQGLRVGYSQRKSNNKPKESSMNCIYSRVGSSCDNSSLDLEWEHEYNQINYDRQPFENPLFTQFNNDAQVLNTTNWNNLPILSNNNDDINSVSSSDEPYEQNQLHSVASMPDIITTSNPHNCNSDDYLKGKQTLFKHLKEKYFCNIIGSHKYDSSWSNKSTPLGSLEWDVVADQHNNLHIEDESLDDETLQLLNQIDHLKNQVLYETGSRLYNCNDYIKDVNNDNDIYIKDLTSFHTTNNYFQLDNNDIENANFS